MSIGVKAPEQPHPPRDQIVDFGESQQPGVARTRTPRPRTVEFDLALEHWKFLLTVLRIFVFLLILLMAINYAAQWLKLTIAIEFREFAQYVIPLFAFLFGMGRNR
jgi:hypothetical protein